VEKVVADQDAVTNNAVVSNNAAINHVVIVKHVATNQFAINKLATQLWFHHMADMVVVDVVR
jgi:hypothetical protein